MGNTKTYYLEGELLAGTTLDQFKEAVYEGFHSTYCVAEIVEEKGGYLGGREGRGPYILAAIHSYSTRGDSGPDDVARLFRHLTMHRLDADWSDIWVCYWEHGRLQGQFRADVAMRVPVTNGSTEPGA